MYSWKLLKDDDSIKRNNRAAPIKIKLRKMGGTTTWQSVSKPQHEKQIGRTVRTYLSKGGRVAMVVGMDGVGGACYSCSEEGRAEPAVSGLAAPVPGWGGLDLCTRWKEAFRVPEPCDHVWQSVVCRWRQHSLQPAEDRQALAPPTGEAILCQLRNRCARVAVVYLLVCSLCNEARILAEVRKVQRALLTR